MLTAAIAAANNGDNQLLTGAAGYKYRVIAFKLSFSGTVNAKFRSGSNDLTGLIYGAAAKDSDSVNLPNTSPTTPPGQFTTNPGEDLNLNLSGAVGVGGFIVYERIAASQ